MSERKPQKKPNPDNLYKRGGIWHIRYSVNGRKIRKSLKTRSVREAKRLRDKILAKRSVAAEFGLDAPVPTKERTFFEVMDLWLESRRADSSLRARSVKLYERNTRIWIKPFFGDVPMSEITVEDVERFITHLRTAKSEHTGRPLSRDTVASIFCTLTMMYRQAIKRDWYAGRNPLDCLDRKPNQGPGRDFALTEKLAEIQGSASRPQSHGPALSEGERVKLAHQLLESVEDFELTPEQRSEPLTPGRDK